eukprot:scaffold12357_cov91-Skeletonema_dohrnii-CCMP3373.AAC.1
MELRDHSYYEANAADVNLEEITSSAENATNLQRLRDGDPTLSHLDLGRGVWNHLNFISFFDIGEGDDLGWLGYFIGKSEYLQRLDIYYLPDGEQQMHAFSEGIARNQSIRKINIHNLNNDTFKSIMRELHSASQLEELDISSINVDPDGWSELRTLLESGVCKLKHLCLRGFNYIGNEGMGVLSNGLIGIGSSLKYLSLRNNSIGNEGLSSLVDALQTCTGLETLHLYGNDFSSAAAGLGSLSVCYRDMNCRINDEGLRALSQGAVNHCEEIDLFPNESITSTGLSYLSSSIRSGSCRVKTLWLQGMQIGDDGMEVLGQGLVGNQSLVRLHLVHLDEGITVTSTGWLAFTTALCNTSSVNSTYLSNHTLCNICIGEDNDTNIEDYILPYNPHQDIFLYLRLNGRHPRYAARCKILMSHKHLDMAPLLHWGLKFLPLAVAWFERAKPCTALTIYDEDPDLRRRVLDESDEAFESRALSAVYEFVRGMPMEVMKSRSELALAAAYDEKIARIEEESKLALEQHDRKNLQLEEEIARLKGENERLSGIVEVVRKSVGV